MKLRPVQALVVSALIATSLTAWADKPIRFLPSPGSLNVPDDWTVRPWHDPDGNFSAKAMGPYDQESMTVWVYPSRVSGPLSDSSSPIKDFLKTCGESKTTVGGSRHETINGLDFYVLPCTQVTHFEGDGPSADQNTLIYFFLGKGHMYQIAVYAKNSDPGKNSDYAKILSSFTTVAP